MSGCRVWKSRLQVFGMRGFGLSFAQGLTKNRNSILFLLRLHCPRVYLQGSYYHSDAANRFVSREPLRRVAKKVSRKESDAWEFIGN